MQEETFPSESLHCSRTRKRDPQRVSYALDMILLSLSVNLYGTKLSSQGGSHRKFSKQGQGTQAFVGVVANLNNDHSSRMPPGGTLNALGSSFPEIGILSMLADSSKPAPGVAQICFKVEVKEGLMAKTEGAMYPCSRYFGLKAPTL